MLTRDLAAAAVPLLANVSSQEPPPGFSEWIRVALYILGGIFLLLGVVEKVRSMTGRNPPVDTDLRRIWEKVEAFEQRLQDRLNDTDKRRSESIKQVNERIEKVAGELHEKINDANVTAAKTEQLTETHTQQLTVMDNKITTILDRLPRKSS